MWAKDFSVIEYSDLRLSLKLCIVSKSKLNLYFAELGVFRRIKVGIMAPDTLKLVDYPHNGSIIWKAFPYHSVITGKLVCYRGDSRFAPSQWKTTLLYNDVSHWLCAGLESAPCVWAQQLSLDIQRLSLEHITNILTALVKLLRNNEIRFIWLLRKIEYIHYEWILYLYTGVCYIYIYYIILFSFFLIRLGDVYGAYTLHNEAICHSFGVNPLHESTVTYCELDHWNINLII